MSVHLKCERCGVMEQTGEVMLFAGVVGPGIPTARPELPDGWSRPLLPTEDGELRRRDLCPACRTALIAFVSGAGDRALPDQPADEERTAVCPTCGPKPLEPHPRLPVMRCSNCKEHVAPAPAMEGVDNG